MTSNTIRGVIPLFFLILFCSFATADYTQIGGDNANFHLEPSIWTTDAGSSSAFLTAPVFAPLIADIYGSAEKEIIVTQLLTFDVYTQDLTLIDSFSHGAISTISAPVIANVSGSPSIVWYDDVEYTLKAYDYNGTFNRVFNITIADIKGVGASFDGAVVSCDANRCYLGVSNVIGANDDRVSYFSVNSTAVISNITAVTGTGAEVFCIPLNPVMPINDYDGDGDSDLIASYFRVDHGGGDSEAAIIHYVNIADTGVLTLAATITEAMGDIIDTGTFCRQSVALTPIPGSYITSPYVANIDGSAGNGKETIIGIQKDVNEFAMFSYLASHSALDRYPEIQDADGVMISNVMGANTDYSNPGEFNTFCVAGYNTDAHQLEILCGSPNTLLVTQTLEFFYDAADFNITPDRYRIHSLTHSGDYFDYFHHSGYDPFNPDEFITPFGILTPNYNNTGIFATCTFLGFCGLDSQYDFGVNNLTLTGADFNATGAADIIGLTDTKLYKFSSGYDNVQCDSETCFNSYTIDPCLNQTWERNTAVEITIKPQDVELNNMQARAILYYGSDNAMDSGFSADITAGNSAILSFTANKTTALSTLRMQVRQGNTSAVDTIDLSFSVSESGAVLGSCTTNVIVGETPEESETASSETGTSANTPTNNAITRGLDAIGAVFSIPAAILWLLFMALLAVLLVVYFSYLPNIGLIIMVVETLLFFLGVALHLISALVTIGVLILGAIIIILYLMAKGGK